jgi:hypothetical protein
MPPTARSGWSWKSSSGSPRGDGGSAAIARRGACAFALIDVATALAKLAVERQLCAARGRRQRSPSPSKAAGIRWSSRRWRDGQGRSSPMIAIFRRRLGGG